MAKNIFYYLCWASIALTLNSLWIAPLISVLRTYYYRTGGIAGEIWLMPIFGWFVSVVAVLVSALISLQKIKTYPDRLHAKGVVWFSISLLLCGPIFAVIYFGVIPILEGRLKIF